MPRAHTLNPVAFAHTIASAKQTMVLSEIARIAFDSFKANKIRFALTALGMVIGSASVILVVTIGLTGKEYVLNLIQEIGSNWIYVDYQGGGSTATPDQQDYMTREDLNAVVTQVPGVMASSPTLEMHNRISLGAGKVKDTLVLGVSPEYRTVRNLVIPTGRFFDDRDADTHAKVALVTASLAEQLFGSAANAINHSFSISGIPFTIIGIFRERVNTFGQSEIADQTILIPYTVARYFTGTDNVKELFFSMRDSGDVPEATKQIQQIISSRHRKTSVYKAQNLSQLVTVAAQIADALTIGLLMISAVTLAVSGIGIMNIMLVNVRSRIREIGIRKAVGATFREIQLQFLTEAVLISLGGGIVGTILGLSVPISVRFFFPDYPVPISIWSVVIALATAMLVGVLFGTLPATRAAQMNPVDSLKYE
jgi:putative ABC transport system permease protein